MAGRYNSWLRAKLAERIERNGGYHARNDSYALSWCVRVYTTGIDTNEDAIKALVEAGHFVNEADLRLQHPDIDEKFTDADFRAAYETAVDQLHEDLSIDEGFKMWSPETTRRYGIDYKGDGAERGLDMGFITAGQGGKHVCLTEFEGRSLNRYNRDLAEAVETHKDGNTYNPLTNHWCRRLMAIMDELDQSLTDDNAERCAYFYATDYFARELGLFD